MPSTPSPRLRLRRFTSLLIAVSFLVLLTSGVLCFLAPKGRVAQELDWDFWGLPREDWIALHLTSSALFLAATLSHLFFNWRPLLKSLRTRSKEARRVSLEALGALVLGGVVVVGTLNEWPVLRELVEWRSSIKHGIDEDSGAQPLEAGEPGAEHGGRGSRGGGQGFGQQTLADLCAQENTDLEAILDRLAARGCVATGDSSLRDLADWLGVSPREVVEVIFAE